MQFLSLILMVAFLSLTSMGCKESVSLSAVDSNNSLIDGPEIDEAPPAPILSEEPVVEEDIEPIEVVVDGDEGSGDELLSDEEVNLDPENDDVADTTDEPEEENKVIVEDNDPKDEEITDEVIADEESEEKCRKHGNLIENGSFEIVDNRKGIRGISLNSILEKKWDVYKSLPSKIENKSSWYTSEGSGIEIQGDKTVATAPHGKRMVELDSHGGKNTNSTMSQDVYLCRGKHIVKFMYYPRTKTKGDNGIEVKINGKVIKAVDMVKDGKWYRIRASFRVKKKDTYKISFSAVGKENSLGALVDKIRLHKKLRRAGVATVLVSLGDKDNVNTPLIKREIALSVISKAVNFSSIKRKPKVLMVKDAYHNGESLDDFVLTESILKELYGKDRVKVHSAEIRRDDIKGFDVIYILNPGYPMGSLLSANTLREAKESGRVGIVIAGDDMARGRNFSMSDLTGLKYKSNGTSACGVRIDNNRGGVYKIKLRKRFFRKLSQEERVLSYANDIDHTEVINKKVRILAMAKVESGVSCQNKFPTIVGYKLKHYRRKNP